MIMSDEEIIRKYHRLAKEVSEQVFGDFWEIMKSQMHPDDVALIQEHNISTLDQLQAALTHALPD